MKRPLTPALTPVHIPQTITSLLPRLNSRTVGVLEFSEDHNRVSRCDTEYQDLSNSFIYQLMHNRVALKEY